MPQVDDITSNAAPESTTIRIHTDVHREMKIAAAHRGEDIIELIRKSWTAFKKAEGKRLHEQQEQ